MGAAFVKRRMMAELAANWRERFGSFDLQPAAASIVSRLPADVFNIIGRERTFGDGHEQNAIRSIEAKDARTALDNEGRHASHSSCLPFFRSAKKVDLQGSAAPEVSTADIRCAVQIMLRCGIIWDGERLRCDAQVEAPDRGLARENSFSIAIEGNARRKRARGEIGGAYAKADEAATASTRQETRQNQTRQNR